MFVQPITIQNTRNPKPSFQSRNLSQELALILSKQKEGAVAVLEKSFSKEEIDGFCLLGALRKIGDHWKSTKTGEQWVEFYREPTEVEAELGRRLALKEDQALHPDKYYKVVTIDGIKQIVEKS